MKTSEVLNRAADLIEERGWTKGNRGMAVKGPHCALGSIGAATGCDDVYEYGGDIGLGYNPSIVTNSEAGLALCVYLGDDPESAEAVWRWNDAEKRTAEQVIAALRAAAVIEAAKETADERESVTA